MNFLFPLLKLKSAGTVAINLIPRQGSWGGANQWTTQVTKFFKNRGWSVRYNLKKPVDSIIITHTGLSAGTSFGVEEVIKFKKKYPEISCLHRINDNDIRKESSAMDLLLEKTNSVANHTIFVSEWLRDHHAARWFNLAKPHSIITPGSDPDVFYPLENFLWRQNQSLRLVTHHWSDNWNKGFDVYQQIDEFIARQQNSKFELWVIGRWPQEIKWKAARTFPPTTGALLADLLRQCHGYVTASRYEPGAMHVAEGLQCGLPLLYHRDSGGTVEQGRRYGMEIQDDLERTLNFFAQQLPELRTKLLADPPSGNKMAEEYFRLVQALRSQG